VTRPFKQRRYLVEEPGPGVRSMRVNHSKAEELSNRPEAFIPLEYVEAYTFHAADLLRAGDAKGAIASLVKALSLDPGDEQALLLRGALAILQGHPGRAISDFSLALSRNA